MVDYRHAWNVRKIQLIVVNIIFAILGIYVGIVGEDIPSGILIWLFGSWMAAAFIASFFSKDGDNVSMMAKNALVDTFNALAAGTGAANGGSGLWVFAFMVFLFKAVFGLIKLTAILVFEFAAYPFTTVNYFVKSRQE